MDNPKTPPYKTNKIKELQVLSITRQDFDDSLKQTDSGGVFIRTNSKNNQSFDVLRPDQFPKVNPNQKKSQQLLPRMDSVPGLTPANFTANISDKLMSESAAWEKGWQMDYSIPSEISGFAFNENLTETKGLMGD
jgi:hypothetical protein